MMKVEGFDSLFCLIYGLYWDLLSNYFSFSLIRIKFLKRCLEEVCFYSELSVLLFS